MFTSLRGDPLTIVIAPELHEIKRGVVVESLQVRKGFKTHGFIHFAGGKTAILRWQYGRRKLEILIYPLKIVIILHHFTVVA